jgi:hypothetical protein
MVPIASVRTEPFKSGELSDILLGIEKVAGDSRGK